MIHVSGSVLSVIRMTGLGFLVVMWVAVGVMALYRVLTGQNFSQVPVSQEWHRELPAGDLVSLPVNSEAGSDE
jgi:hypothetical protein